MQIGQSIVEMERNSILVLSFKVIKLRILRSRLKGRELRRDAKQFASVPEQGDIG